MTTRILHLIVALTVALGLAAPSTFAKSKSKSVSIALAPTFGQDSGVAGQATYTVKGSRAWFEVEVEGLPMGFYDLYVDGGRIADFTVDPDLPKSHGGISFDTKRKNGALRLNFDPRGKSIEVYNGLVVVLAGVLPGSAPGEPVQYSNYAATIAGDAIDPDPGSGRPPRGSLKIRSTKNYAWMRFEIQLLQEVPHTLTANGVTIATISPLSHGFARVQFSTDPSNGDLPLDFDPAGVTYRVVRGDTPVLEFVADEGTIGGGLEPVRYYARPLFPTGVQLGAEGGAELDSRGAKLDLHIHIGSVIPGPYTLRIAGSTEGAIVVSIGSTDGDLNLSNYRSGIGISPLTMDPRGRTIEVLSGGVVVLQTQFPQ